jgi:hypothetical protein
VGARFGYGYPFYGSRYFYDPFWWGGYGFGFQYGPFSPYPYYPYYPYYGGYPYQPGADMRIQVTPRDAQVYIDGYLTGVVDDFDGMLQRLRLPLGEHEITVYLDGYVPFREKMLIRPYETYHIKQALQPLAAGATPEPRPAPVERAQPQQDPNRGGPPMPAPRGRPDRAAPDQAADRFGSVAIRVQPADAEVLIDGERWETAAGESRLLVQLSEGTHRVEVRKDGFRTYTSTVRVRSGQTETLNISLPTGG